MISLLGVPLDENSSFLKGTSGAPPKIREAFHSDSTSYFSENGVDLKNSSIWKDVGDIGLSGMPESFEEITSAVYTEVAEGNKVISLGGDHSISYPILKAFAKKYKDLNILHLDAHGDLYDTFEGSKFSHACPFARIMEEKLASRLISIGIRTLNTHQREQAKKFKVETIEMKDWVDSMEFSFTGPVYISLDLDALDPAFVPGISHYEPGGFTTRQVISIIQRLQGNIVGADIVELNPHRDINNMTAMVAARFLKEIMAKMISTDGN
jgi:arginase